MSRFDIEETLIPELKVIQRKPHGDERGYLERLFCADELRTIIAERGIVQINHTFTAKAGAVRGIRPGAACPSRPARGHPHVRSRCRQIHAEPSLGS